MVARKGSHEKYLKLFHIWGSISHLIDTDIALSHELKAVFRTLMYWYTNLRGKTHNFFFLKHEV